MRTKALESRQPMRWDSKRFHQKKTRNQRDENRQSSREREEAEEQQSLPSEAHRGLPFQRRDRTLHRRRLPHLLRSH